MFKNKKLFKALKKNLGWPRTIEGQSVHSTCSVKVIKQTGLK